MKKWFENVKDWCFYNSEIITTVVVITIYAMLFAALVVAAVVGFTALNNGETLDNGETINNAIWLINPANPASPLH